MYEQQIQIKYSFEPVNINLNYLISLKLYSVEGLSKSENLKSFSLCLHSFYFQYHVETPNVIH